VVISYLSYQMKRELYYVSSAAARRSDTSAWRRTSKIVDLFRTKSQEKKFVRDLGVYKKTRVTAIKRSKKEREKKKKLCTRYVFDILWRIVYLLYSPTDFVESSRAIRSGKKQTDFGQSMRLFGNLLTFIIETKKIYEEKKMLIGLVACALIAH
jgi:ABC-type anion transport system duplicated permease subunit